jgi:hypothetical protein
MWACLPCRQKIAAARNARRAEQRAGAVEAATTSWPIGDVPGVGPSQLIKGPADAHVPRPDDGNKNGARAGAREG